MRNARKKQTGRAFSLAAAFSSLMLCFLMLQSFIFSKDGAYASICYAIADALANIISGITDLSFADVRKSVISMMNTEVFSTCFNIFIYLFTIIVPFSILSKSSGVTAKQAFKLNTDSKKMFWLYIPFTIGAGYSVNLAVRLIFGDQLDRFIEAESHLPQTAAGIVLYFIMIAFLPAIVEEWAFRGVLLRSLLPYGRLFALTVSSVIFGLMHVNPPQAAFAACFGFLAGFIYIKTGSIWYGVLIHLLNNACSVLLGFAIQFRGIGSPESVVLTMLYLGTMVCFIVGLVVFIRSGFFGTGVMHSVAPPDKPKLYASQYLSLSAANVFTVLFAVFYIVTLLIRFYPETLKING